MSSLLFIICVILGVYIYRLRAQRRAVLNALAPALLLGSLVPKAKNRQLVTMYLKLVKEGLSPRDNQTLIALYCKAYGVKSFNKRLGLSDAQLATITKQYAEELAVTKTTITERLRNA